jgi:hypothetical protein
MRFASIVFMWEIPKIAQKHEQLQRADKPTSQKLGKNALR